MLNEKVQKALNEQVNAELYSSYLYVSMSAYFESIDLPGHASWMRCQAQEELVHAMKFYGYIHDRDGRVLVTAIDAPPTEWNSALAAFEAAYEHEQHVSSLINGLVDLARAESDHATYNTLQWFVEEQVEEEASAKAVVQQLKLVGSEGRGMFMVDRELGQRTFVLPVPGAEGGAQ